MTVALFGADVAIRSYLGCKALKRGANNKLTSCQKMFKLESQEGGEKRIKDACSDNYEKRGEVDGSESSDVARGTYFSDGIANYTGTESSQESASLSSSTITSVDSNHCVICQGGSVSANVTIKVACRSFYLCKCPLIAMSGYLKRTLTDSNYVELPSDFPGGEDIFKLVVNFCSSLNIEMNASNVAGLRCAAEFLEMTEEQSKHNLCERVDNFFNEVVLKSWSDTLTCLQKSEILLPLVEEMLIVTRCIDSLAFVACIESLDFEAREEMGTAYHSSESQNWSASSSCSMNAPSPVWWIKELLHIPSVFFGRVIKAFRKQRMPEKYVCLAIMSYVEEWLFTSGDTNLRLDDISRINLLEDVVGLLPLQTYMLPVGFLLSLLKVTLGLNASNDCRLHLETRIASQLELATVEDFVMPTANAEKNGTSESILNCMAHIVSLFLSQHQSAWQGSEAMHDVFAVAKIWDAYLERVASEENVPPSKLAFLLDAIPANFRVDHDQMYRTVSRFFKAHPHISQEERDTVCRSLNCQKLSQEVCVQVLRNDLMPMRIVVQAMYAQHIQTRKVLHNHFRVNKAVMNEYVPQSVHLISPNRDLNIWTSRIDPDHENINPTITNDDRMQHKGLVCSKRFEDKQIAHLQSTFLKADMEETNSKLRCLEEELANLKQAFNRALRMETASSEEVTATRAFRGLDYAAKSFHNVKKDKRIKSQSNVHPHVYRKGRVVQTVLRTVFQKIGFSNFCRSRHDFDDEAEMRWLENDRYELSETGHATSCDDSLSSHCSSQMPEGRQRHARHYSLA